MLILPIQITVCEIPQCTKFGPVLFLLQIIDIPDPQVKHSFVYLDN